MEKNSYTVTANQGSQPTLGSLRVGVIDVARFNDLSKARLLLRPATGDKAVTMAEGESRAVPGYGLLVLQEVNVAGNGSVTLSLEGSPEAD